MDRVMGQHGRRRPGPVEWGIVAGIVAAAAIFATRLIGDDLAASLFRLSYPG